MWSCGPDSVGTAGVGFDTASLSHDAAIVGLATKFMTLTPSGEKATVDMNLVGTGRKPAGIITEIMNGAEELVDPSRVYIPTPRTVEGKPRCEPHTLRPAPRIGPCVQGE